MPKQASKIAYDTTSMATSDTAPRKKTPSVTKTAVKAVPKPVPETSESPVPTAEPAQDSAAVSPHILFHNGQPFEAPRWIEKTISLALQSPDDQMEMVLYLQCGPAKLYQYFPFLVWFYLDDKPVYVTEFTREYEAAVVVLPLPAAGSHVLRIDSELTGCPKARGLSEDLRHLSLQINSVEWRPATRTPRRPQAQIRYHQNRYEPISDHTGIRPIFVIGAYRSGTSISTWILGQHPNITPTEENIYLLTKYFSAIANHNANSLASESFTRIYDLSLKDYLQSEGEHFHNFCVRAAKQRTHAKLLESISCGKSVFDPGFALVRGAYNPKSRWVNGTPEYSNIALGLVEMFPNARMIFLLRRPQDVISSLMRFDAMGEQAQTFQEAAWNWERLCYRAYEAYKRLGADTVFFADYERLRSDPAGLIREWWEFLEEPYFDKAVETTRMRINSSGDEQAPVEIDKPTIDRLNAIYLGMCAGAPIGSLPWRADLGSFESVRGEISNRFMRLITDPAG